MVKIFNIHESQYNDDFLNKWAEDNKVKITSVNVCPGISYLNNSKTGITDINLIVTIVYHKKRTRKKENIEIKE